MSPPEEDNKSAAPQYEIKLEQDELTDLQEQMQPEGNFEEHADDQFPAGEADLCNFKNENITIEHYDNVDNFQEENEKNSMIMENIIEESSEITYENINNTSFGGDEGMETETTEQSSHQESFFPLPCEKQEMSENSMLDANIITESDDGFESYGNEIIEPAEQNDSKEGEFQNEPQQMQKTFYYEEPTEEEDEEEEEEDETIVQSEEYFQEEQSTDNEVFTEEPVFMESNFQNVEEYGSSEQIIETTESEIPPVFINDEMSDSVQGIVSEETVMEGDYKTYAKGKSLISKEGVLQLSQSNANVKKIVSDNISSVQTSLKRPLLPGPGQPKNVFTKVIIQGNPNASGITPGQPFKIIGNASSSLVPGQTRSISLAQAQQMGLLAPGTKIQQIIPSSSSTGVQGQKRMIYKKIAPTCSSSLLTPSNAGKSPTKILPAPSPAKGNNIRPSLATAIRGPVSVANIQTFRGSMPVATLKAVPSIPSSNRPVPVAAITALRQSGFSNVNLKPVGTVKNLPGTQKVIIRQGQLPLKSGTIINPSSSGQVIRIPANANTLQPIQISGSKQVQYVRFVSGSGNTIPTTVLNNTKPKMVKSPITQSVKSLPIVPNTSSTVKTVLPKPSSSNSSTTTKRILIPVSQGMSQLCIANDLSTGSEEGEDGEKQQTITTVPITLQQLKNTGSITAIPSSAVAHLRQGRSIATLTNSQLAQLKSGQASGIQIKAPESGVIPVSAVNQVNSEGSFIMSEGQLVMLPAEIVQQIQGDTSNGETIMESNEKAKLSSENEVNDEEFFERDRGDSDGCRSTSPGRILEANGIRMKKPCNCTRSQCLKLYCECFANGEFCFQCNCNNCFNNIQHEEERQKSIRSCLERNPSAFRPKIQIGETEEDERRHNKGCHCKRSGCLKNYCECYEAKITCSKSCKCIGCKNTEEFLEGTRSGLIELADAVEESYNSEQKSDSKSQSNGSNQKQPYNFMSSEVVEATCQCLLAQAEEAERNGLNIEQGEKLIIEEFGRCLVQIIGCTTPEENAAR